MQHKNKIFFENEAWEFRKFLVNLHKNNIIKIAHRESKHLTPIFQHASNVIAPYSQVHFDAINTIGSAEAWKNAYNLTAKSNATVFLNQTIIFDKTICPKLENLEIKNQKTNFYLTESGKEDVNLKMPDFGFLTSQYISEKSNRQQNVILPYICLPNEFMKLIRRTGSENFLLSLSKLGFFVNHDWYHSLSANVFNSNVTLLPQTAPINLLQSNESLLEAYVMDCHLPKNQSLPKIYLYQDVKNVDTAYRDYEGWSVCFEKEILLNMMETENNPFIKEIEIFKKEYQSFISKIPANTCIKELDISAKNYAINLTAFILFRAAPSHHPLFSSMFDDFKEIFYFKDKIDELQNKNDLTQRFFSKGTLSTSERYADAIKQLIAHMTTIAKIDALKALELYEENQDHLGKNSNFTVNEPEIVYVI